MKHVTVEVTFGVDDDFDPSGLGELVEGGLDILGQSDSEEMDGVLEYGAEVK